MALGNSNYGGNNKQKQDPSYYSKLRFSERGDTSRSVRLKYWKGMMCISITSEGAQEDGYKIDDIGAIYLSPLKSLALANSLDEFINDENHAPVGVNVGISEVQTCVVFQHVENGGVRMIISKIDASGNRSGEQEFTFTGNYDYYLEFKDYEKMKFDKHYVPYIQIKMIITALREFYTGLCGGMAYSVMEFAKFDISRTSTKLNVIMDKLGIQRLSSYNSGGSGENSYFNRNGAAPQGSTYSDHHNAEDLDELIS